MGIFLKSRFFSTVRENWEPRSRMQAQSAENQGFLLNFVLLEGPKRLYLCTTHLIVTPQRSGEFPGRELESWDRLSV